MDRPSPTPPTVSLPRRRRRVRWWLVGALIAALGIRSATIRHRALVEAPRNYGSAELTHLNAPYVTSPEEIVERMLDLAELDQHDVVYDLGCGDGRILIAAARRFKCHGVGYEYDERIAEVARQNVRENQVEALVTIYQRDIFTLENEELDKASVITLYLLPWMNEKLLPQLAELAPGKVIVSHEWDLPGVKPDKIVLIDSRDQEMPGEHAIYVWKTPLDFY